MALKKQFNAIKAEEFSWVFEVTKYAAQQPFLHLQAAFRNFFAKRGRYPRFKRKGVHDSFYIGNDHVKLDGKRIWIPKLGWVRMREELRFRGRLVSATVSRTADQWFVSLSVELEQIPQRCESQAAIALEDLNVKGMLSNRYLARAIADIGFYELRRQLEYKAALKGNHIEVADRWFPSSKMCSSCGEVKEELRLSERSFQCEACGTTLDRDENAARNLLRTVSSTGTEACGEGGSGSSTRWSETILCEAGTWT